MSATVAAPIAGRSVVLYGVDWPTYTRLLKLFNERPGMRMTYDRGALEIMSPLSSDHERVNRLIAQLVDHLRLTLRYRFIPGGSTTLRRHLKKRGLEPDNCYWIANVDQVIGKRRITLRNSPPPDLAIEVEETTKCIKRLPVYAALGFPEVWRLTADGQLTFNLLDSQTRRYQVGNSVCFPGLTPMDLMPILGLVSSLEHLEILDRFRIWLQTQIAAGRWTPNP